MHAQGHLNRYCLYSNAQAGVVELKRLKRITLRNIGDAIAADVLFRTLHPTAYLLRLHIPLLLRHKVAAHGSRNCSERCHG